MKQFLAIIAITLIIGGYLPYFRDIVRGKTHPHIYSWILWALLTVVIFGVQVSHHAGLGGYVTLAAGICCLTVILLSFKYGRRDIVVWDKVVFGLTLVTIAAWIFTNRPLLAIVLATLADLLAFVPTVRKSWRKPYTETLSLYELNVIRFFLAYLALDERTLVNALWPITWAITNIIFALMLIYRRQQIPQPKNT